MEKKSKQGLRSSSKPGNAYENERKKTIAENNKIFKDLGLPAITKSLGSSKRTQKNKAKQLGPTNKDEDYSPTSDDENDGEQHNEQADTIVAQKKVPKKKQAPIFVPPSYITRRANLAKKRVALERNLSQGVTQTGKGQQSGKTMGIKRRIQPSTKGSKINRQLDDTVHRNQTVSSETFKKGKNDVLVCDENAASDNDDQDALAYEKDVGDDETVASDDDDQDALAYEKDVGDDETVASDDDDLNDLANENDVRDDETVASDDNTENADDAGPDERAAIDFDSETEDVARDDEMATGEKNDDTVNDASDDERAATDNNTYEELADPETETEYEEPRQELNNELNGDDVVVGQEDDDADQRPQKRRRGPTGMKKIWGMKDAPRINIVVNAYGQPINADSTKLSHFMGTIARTPKYCPLYQQWNKVKEVRKRRILRKLRTKFIIPDNADKWILKSIGRQVKNWRARIKKDYHDPSLSLRRQIRSRAPRVPKRDWIILVNYWNEEYSKAVSETNKVNRSKKKMVQLTGKKSYARVREELKAKEGKSPTRYDMFKTCFTKGGSAKTVEAESALENMEQLKSSLPEESIDEHGPNDLFSRVRGNNKYGYADMYGLGVRASDLWGKRSRDAASEIEIVQLKSRNAELERKLAEKNDSNGQELTAPQIPVVQNVPSRLNVGKEVFLHNFSAERVGKGRLKSLDPSMIVNGLEIGGDWCAVDLQVVIKRGEPLMRPFDMLLTIEDATGTDVAWPTTLVSVVPFE